MHKLPQIFKIYQSFTNENWTFFNKIPKIVRSMLETGQISLQISLQID